MSKKKHKNTIRKPPMASEGKFFSKGYKPNTLPVTIKRKPKRRFKYRTIRTTLEGKTEFACIRCGQFFAPEDLVKNANSPRGFRMECKKCWAEQCKTYRKNNKQKIAAIDQKNYRNRSKKLKVD